MIECLTTEKKQSRAAFEVFLTKGKEDVIAQRIYFYFQNERNSQVSITLMKEVQVHVG